MPDMLAAKMQNSSIRSPYRKTDAHCQSCTGTLTLVANPYDSELYFRN